MYRINKAFTLIEMIVSVTLFAMIMIMIFAAMGNLSNLKLTNSLKLDLDTDLYYSIENLVTTMKDFNGTIDFEEYWNRSTVGVATSSGHYSAFDGYGNFGSGGSLPSTYGDYFYYCRSGNSGGIPGSQFMGTGGCLAGFNNYSSSFAGKFQRYGQYAFQFIDYNSDQNGDLGNEDGDGSGNIRGDEDDTNLGMGPAAFAGNEVKELYLIKKGKDTERLFFRLTKNLDTPFAPSGATCSLAGDGNGCRGSIQMLRLIGKDYGINHNGSSSGAYDGIIDTWECSPEYLCNGPTTIGSGKLVSGVDDGWIDLLPAYINVKSFKLFVYPNKSQKNAWQEANDSTNINPYVRINMNIGFAWDKKRYMKGLDPTVNIETTINLTNQ